MSPPNKEGNEKELQATTVKKESGAITADSIDTKAQKYRAS